MQQQKLGRSGIEVSRICLGTMTWGEQNSEAEAHAQLDAALDFGVNFIDTAEMYPVPPMASTYGETERCIGSWLKARNNRDKVILATKVMSRSDDLTYVRDGNMRLDHKNITAALDASLERLQTDYVDLYQLHWPDRKTNYFGQLGYRYPEADESVPIEESLQVLADLVRSGKVRHVGISNETPWGAMRFMQLAETRVLPRAVSIQNPYSLLNRTFEVGLAEISHREQLGLLAYSPLAFGTLSGKYLNGAQPADGRLTLYSRFSRYTSEVAQLAIAAYVALARQHGLDPAQMALAYLHSRPFITSTIIGATTMPQLQSNLESINLTLDDDVIAGIEAIHQRYPNPCP
jgi:aryl-alcohol dehydrogenase-like predicted oxidoreductase